MSLKVYLIQKHKKLIKKISDLNWSSSINLDDIHELSIRTPFIYKPEIEVITNKSLYDFYDMVMIKITNHGGSTLEGTSPPYEIYDKWDNMVAGIYKTVNITYIEPEESLIAIGSGGPFAQSAARALQENTDLSAEEIVRKGLKIA